MTSDSSPQQSVDWDTMIQQYDGKRFEYICNLRLGIRESQWNLQYGGWILPFSVIKIVYFDFGSILNVSMNAFIYLFIKVTLFKFYLQRNQNSDLRTVGVIGRK